MVARRNLSGAGLFLGAVMLIVGFVTDLPVSHFAVLIGPCVQPAYNVVVQDTGERSSRWPGRDLCLKREAEAAIDELKRFGFPAAAPRL
jgi:hypothetical protein